MTGAEPDLSLGEQVDAQGWFSGAVIPMAMAEAALPYFARHNVDQVEIKDVDWLVVVSQTCDIVCHSELQEPFIEVLLCRPIEALRGEYQGRKSTRILDLKPNPRLHPELALTAHAVRDRYTIPRSFLIGGKPDDKRVLSEAAIANIQQWYALRYTRPAWPDAFNARFSRGMKKRLAAALKGIPTDEVEVRVAIAESEDELEDAEDYHIVVFFIVDQEQWDNSPAIREAATLAYASFISAIEECPNIDVNPEIGGVLSGDAFSWQQTRSTDEWNFANLSDND